LLFHPVAYELGLNTLKQRTVHCGGPFKVYGTTVQITIHVL